MNWKTKSRILRLLSLAPNAQQLLFLVQKHVTKEVPRRESSLELLLNAARDIFGKIEKHRSPRPMSGVNLVEIGAGRDLAVALALRLMGVGQVTCVDISPMVKIDLVARAAAYMAQKLGKPVPAIGSMQDLNDFGIRYLAPTTLKDAGIEDGSVDAFISVDTLEHIPVDALRETIAAASALLASDGVMINFVDYSDHYARPDPSISRFNFLSFSDKDWEPHNSPLHFVNRLRHSEYIEIFEKNSFAVKECETNSQELPIEIVIDKMFEKFEKDDIRKLYGKTTCSKISNTV